MQQLIFIYDGLMTRHEQIKAEIGLTFVSFAQVYGKLYRINDGKRMRIFCVPSKGVSTRLVYGGLFLVDDYEIDKLKLFAYYNNSYQYTHQTLSSDLFDFVTIPVTPIKFDSLSSIEQNTYTKGIPIDCSCFIGNPLHKRIQFNITKSYYKVPIDRDNFITMIKENVNGNTD